MSVFSNIFLNLKKLFNVFFKKMRIGHALGTLSRNACRGWPNSQLELAKVYLYEVEDIIEAYAWADVACYRGLQGARDVKEEAQSKLKPEQIKVAFDLARQYKLNFAP